MSNTPVVSRLRMLREERGWTQQDVADHLGRLAWVHSRERVGANADMVAKWERGVKVPSRRYRALLALLFGVDSDELAPTHAAKAQNRRPEEGEISGLLDSLGSAAALLDELGSIGLVIQPKMFSVWKEQILRRRVLLKMVGLTPMVGLDLSGAMPPSVKPTADVVSVLDDLANRYQALYHSTAPSALLIPVIAHLETVAELLGDNVTPSTHRKLLANRARVAMLAGRLAFFDLHDTMAARGYYSVALESAREAGDHLQAASALGHTAFIPAAERGYQADLDYVVGANMHVSKRPDRLMSSWLAAVESELHTNAGSISAAQGAIARARSELAANELIGHLSWFDYYDETRLDGFAGYVEPRGGNFLEAQRTLTGALERLPLHAIKQRAIFLADLATVHLNSGDVDQACCVAGMAADQLRRAGYATGSGRLREFRAAVDPWASSVAVRALDEQLALIA